MEKFNYLETKSEQESLVPEKIKHTNTILARLALWGVIAFNPLQATETKTPGLDNKEGIPIEQIFKEASSKKVRAFERRFLESRLISMETKHEKPVIVIVTKESIEENYSGKKGFIKTQDDFLSQQLTLELFDQGVDIVERSSGATNAIINEVVLGETGLIDWDQRVKLGGWSSSDYYVVSSVKKTENDSFVFINEIINMKDGSIMSVNVESPSEHSDTSVVELAEKTKSAIQKSESQKHE